MESTPYPFLATYGVLMRTFGGPRRLGLADRMAFEGRCQFTGVLYDLDRFPGAVPGEGLIHGDLFRLCDPQVWTLLDRFEGYDSDCEGDSLFVRRKISLKEPTGHAAWVYWYNDVPTDCPRVPSGDWATYVGVDDRE